MLRTWFRLMSGLEIKSDQACEFDSSKLNNHATTYLAGTHHTFFVRYLTSPAASEKSW